MIQTERVVLYALVGVLLSKAFLTPGQRAVVTVASGAALIGLCVFFWIEGGKS